MLHGPVVAALNGVCDRIVDREGVGHRGPLVRREVRHLVEGARKALVKPAGDLSRTVVRLSPAPEMLGERIAQRIGRQGEQVGRILAGHDFLESGFRAVKLSGRLEMQQAGAPAGRRGRRRSGTLGGSVPVG